MVHREHIHIITILASATVVQVTTTLPGTRDRNKTRASVPNLSTGGCYQKRTILLVGIRTWNGRTATTARRYRRKRLQIVLSTSPIAIAATGTDAGCGIRAGNGWQLKAAPQLVAQHITLGVRIYGAKSCGASRKGRSLIVREIAKHRVLHAPRIFANTVPLLA